VARAYHRFTMGKKTLGSVSACLLGTSLALAVAACGSNDTSSRNQPTPDGGGGDLGSGGKGAAGSGGGGAGAAGFGGSGAAGGGGGSSGGAGAAGGGAGGSTQADAGASCIDPGSFPTPPGGTLSVESTCGGAVTACGGNVEGKTLALESWCVTSDSLNTRIRSVCSAASIGSASTGSASGSVSFSAGSFTLDLQGQASVDVGFPNACTFGQCGALESSLTGAGLFGNCGSDGSGGCFCTVERFFTVKDSGTYTVSGTTITTSSGQKFDYCLGSSGLTLEQTSGSATVGAATFAKPTATPEKCDGIDNDLNGIVDDDPRDCPPCNTAGVCATFSATCQGQAGWTCSYTSPDYQANETACDGKDNDCDGLVDEPSPEVCNGKDDDCNGTKDDPAAADADCVSKNGAGYVCQGGLCTCPHVCGGTCADIGTDTENCGACGTACPAGGSCVAGKCQCPASAPTDCTTKCADLSTDAKNCGTCGNACSVACDAGTCISVKDIELADYTVCALMSNGTVRCWGNGSSGALGNGDTSNSATPVIVKNLTTAAGLATGTRCSWLAGKTAVCWGENYFGEVGDGTKNDAHTPVAVSGLSSVAGMAAASQFTCAWTTAGSAYCWGDGTSDQLGDPSAGSPLTPHLVPNLSGVKQMAVGLQHTCALKSDGTAICFGSNIEGQLGATGGASVSGLTGAVEISLGALHSCARLSNGTVKCWGDNGYGELGDGSGKNQPAPVLVSGLTGVTQIAAGGEHTCALLGDGTAKCWGWNQDQELGDGTTAPNQPTPQPVVGLTGVKKIVCGGENTCALLDTGEVKCWGGNSFGQCGTGAKANPVGTPTTIVW